MLGVVSWPIARELTSSKDGRRAEQARPLRLLRRFESSPSSFRQAEGPAPSPLPLGEGERCCKTMLREPQHGLWQIATRHVQRANRRTTRTKAPPG